MRGFALGIVSGTVALLLTLVLTLLLSCSSSRPADSVAPSPSPVPHPTADPLPRPAVILADVFENLPSPMPTPLPFVEGSSTIAVLPDTQVYTERFPEVFEEQTRWIANHHESRDIRFAIHLGDITEHAVEQEWEAAVNAMQWLDGVVPYALAPGNHDYAQRGRADTRFSLLSTYFPVRKFRGMPTFGGTYQAGIMDNSFHLFTAGGREWIVLVLEWGPRQDVMNWAGRVLRAHANRTAIVVTHAYLFHDGTRYDQKREDQPWNPHQYPTADLPGGVSDGEELWEGLISNHGNVAMVLCGHVLGRGVGLLSSKGRVGNTVHQMLSNYQMRPGGGQGYFRLLELLPDGKTVRVKTYSPVLDNYLTMESQQFELEIDVRLGAACQGSGPCDLEEGEGLNP